MLELHYFFKEGLRHQHAILDVYETLTKNAILTGFFCYGTTYSLTSYIGKNINIFITSNRYTMKIYSMAN